LGLDLADNDGKLDRYHFETLGTDIGFQLWDVAYPRQKPKAGPAK
jgi:hypothetical protein